MQLNVGDVKHTKKREREGQHEAESEEPSFGADDDDGWIDVRAESPPPPLKVDLTSLFYKITLTIMRIPPTMRELLNQNSDKLHPAEVVHTYKQSQKGVTEQINREARQASRQKYHHNIKEEYKKYCSEQPIPPIGSNDILLIDFDEMRYENIQGTRTTPTILHLIRRFSDPANLCPACFAPDESETEPLGYLSVDGNFQLKRRVRASDGEEDVPASTEFAPLTEKRMFLHRSGSSTAPRKHWLCAG
ncbi:hypothetical protein V1506DRAFT_507350 [Lipomyces tetrasporus]